ncbi:MAG: PPC domain-containing protein, partial [Planctomycetes bacterium]|nr:PPC domain-containing protein [Planctomycetota bacterium]
MKVASLVQRLTRPRHRSGARAVHRRWRFGLQGEVLEHRLLLTCTEDAFEENDTKAGVDARAGGAANSPNLGTVTGQLVFQNLVLNDSADWYKFVLADVATTAHAVEVSFDRTLGDVDLYVYRADGTTRVGESTRYSSSSNGGVETVSLAGELSQQSYYVRVVAKSSNEPVLCSYELSIAAPQPGVDDAYEDNDTKTVVDGRAEGAANSPNFGVLTSPISIQNLKLDDAADVYRFQTAGVGTTDHQVEISFDRTWGDIDLYVYRSDGSTRVEESTRYSSNSGVETVSLAGELTGVFYVLVVAKSTAARQPPGIAAYSLAITPPPAAPDDAYEENDTKGVVDARTEGAADSPNLGLLTSPISISNLKLDDAADWYKFQTAGVGTTDHQVEISFDRTWGDIDLYVYRSDGSTRVEESTRYSSNSGVETVSLAGELSGVFYVLVVAKSTAARQPP